MQDFKSDGWTSSDIAEWNYENPDDDFSTSYAKGRFSEPCPLCNGRNVVTEEEAEEYDNGWEMRAEIEAERRMGC